MGPVYADDGRLVVGESFTKRHSVQREPWLKAGLQALLSSDDYVESWRIWDCYTQDWDCGELILHRFESSDLVVRQLGDGICTWRGAIDTSARITPSLDDAENEQKCWQWLRYGRVS